jgi:hypothetical protein
VAVPATTGAPMAAITSAGSTGTTAQLLLPLPDRPVIYVRPGAQGVSTFPDPEGRIFPNALP